MKFPQVETFALMCFFHCCMMLCYTLYMMLLMHTLSGPDRKGHQFSCVCLHGDRKPQERKQNLERFKVM